MDSDRLLVVTCDSCGGIGDKELDMIAVPAELVGRFTARVAIAELMAVGAIPHLLAVAICSEPEPTGTKILIGIDAELKAAGLDGLSRVVSTEKNVATRQTGLGISVTGISSPSNLKVNLSKQGDAVYCMGLPKVGQELDRADDPEIAQIEHLMKLLPCANVHDVLPIGSRGILEETNQLAERVDCQFLQTNHSIDVQKSAGPSTCVVFTGTDVLPGSFPASLPLVQIGRLISQ